MSPASPVRLFPFALAALALGAGCSPRPPAAAPTGPARDSVFVSGTPTLPPDLVREAALQPSQGAQLDTVTVGEFSLLQAETPAQFAAAQRAVGSGMSLSDPALLLRLATPRDGNSGTGAAAATPPVDLDRPFVTEFVFRLTPNEGPGYCAGLGVCDRVSLSLRLIGAALPADGRRMPSSLGLTLGGPFGRLETADLTLGHGDDLSSTVAEVPVPIVEGRGPAHRLRLAYTPGEVQVTLDGASLFTEAVRLGGPPARLSLFALSGKDGPGVVVTSWSLTQTR